MSDHLKFLFHYHLGRKLLGNQDFKESEKTALFGYIFYYFYLTDRLGDFWLI